jgi:hypothetical protein
MNTIPSSLIGRWLFFLTWVRPAPMHDSWPRKPVLIYKNCAVFGMEEFRHVPGTRSILVLVHSDDSKDTSARWLWRQERACTKIPNVLRMVQVGLPKTLVAWFRIHPLQSSSPFREQGLEGKWPESQDDPSLLMMYILSAGYWLWYLYICKVINTVLCLFFPFSI